MNYHALLRPASFRGYAFGLPQDTITQARRIATHQYPGKDEPYHEDMGLDVRQIAVEAVIAGPEFIASADRFEALLNKEGSGVLIHPYYGSLEVIMMSYTRTNAYDRLGEVTFSITFEKFGKPMYPKALGNTAHGLNQSADAAHLAIHKEFFGNFSFQHMPGFVLSDAISRVSDFSRRIEGIFNAAQSPFKWSLNDLSTLHLKARSLLSSLTGTIKNNRRTSVIRDLAIIPSNNLSGLQSVRGKNAAAIDLLMRGSSLASAITLASSANYESRGEAIGIKDVLNRSLETTAQNMADLGWDESWKALGVMQSAISRDINERLGRLPYTIKLRTFTPRSALVLSNMVYGDNPAQIITKAEDIITRNAVRNPAIISAPSVLEVLVDAA